MKPLRRGLAPLFAAALAALAGCDGRSPSDGSTPTVQPAKHAQSSEAPNHAHPEWAARVRGIDISNWQGGVDWGQVKGAGLGFAYLQATQGVDFIDPNFEENVKGVTAAGLPYGAYHFFRPNDDAEKQAELFLRKTQGRLGELPPMLDVEITAGMSAERIGKAAKRWLEIVGKAVGCTPLLYSYGGYWERNLRGVLADYPLWLADYAHQPTLPAGKDRWTFWQYSQKGRVAGVKGPVDLDWFNGDTQALEGLRCVKEG